MYAAGIAQGDEVIVPAMTFAATANGAIYQGGVPVFADVEAETLLLDTGSVEAKITARTKAVVAVDYAGHACDYDSLREICERHGLVLLADGCHALGGEYKGRRVGSLADLTVFSFHPVKHITTGEGGAITTDDDELYLRLRLFRNHGMTADFRQRAEAGSWYYEIVDLGYNYRITDIQCALGCSQLKKLPAFLKRRREIAGLYDVFFEDIQEIRPLAVRGNVRHAYHLYVVRIDFESLALDRKTVFGKMRDKGIEVNVHYIPVYLHPYYRKRFGLGPGLCPVAEAAYEKIVSLPLCPKLSDSEVNYVRNTLWEVVGKPNQLR
jgi:perosamine synthetase